jgi:hypothetical protein
MSTCYVIATYQGPRRYRDGGELSRHLDQLNRLPHKLDHVVVVNNYDYAAQKIQTFGAELIERPNVGGSYGAFNAAFKRHHDKFDYYIFVEDDYVPVAKEFDTILHALIMPKTGYLCGLVANFPVYHEGMRLSVPHAAISNGIARTSALLAVERYFGNLPYSNAPSDYGKDEMSQVLFSNAFLYAGYELQSWLPSFCTPAMRAGGMVIHGSSDKPALIAPIEWLDFPAEKRKDIEVGYTYHIKPLEMEV